MAFKIDNFQNHINNNNNNSVSDSTARRQDKPLINIVSPRFESSKENQRDLSDLHLSGRVQEVKRTEEECSDIEYEYSRQAGTHEDRSPQPPDYAYTHPLNEGVSEAELRNWGRETRTKTKKEIFSQVFHSEVQAHLRGFPSPIITQEDRRYYGKCMGEKREGFGIEILTSGTIYKGNWKADKKDGDGVIVSADGTIFKGKFLNGKACEGIMFSSDGSMYEGQIQNGTYHGQGALYNSQGGLICRGAFNEGVFVG